jgi:hypothetical protein
MDLITIGEKLFDVLEQFDTDILPLGLYASDDLVEGKKQKPRHQELHKAIFPYFLSQGFSEEFYFRDNYASCSSFKTPDGGVIGLTVVKFSSIKVQKYGSGYHVDKHEDRKHRWEQADLSGHISALWKQPDMFDSELEARLLLFIGFDKSQRPFERELVELEQTLKWNEKNVCYLTRTWLDKAERGFSVRLSFWSQPVDAS